MGKKPKREIMKIKMSTFTQLIAEDADPELIIGRMFKFERGFLVLVLEIHFWVSCLFYSLEICCLPFLEWQSCHLYAERYGFRQNYHTLE